MSLMYGERCMSFTINNKMIIKRRGDHWNSWGRITRRYLRPVGHTGCVQLCNWENGQREKIHVNYFRRSTLPC